MILNGDTTRPRSVKCEFDQNFNATSHGGIVLEERTLRRLGIFHILKTILPERSEACTYQTEDWAYAFMASILLGGRGISATERLRSDEILCRILGLEKGAPSASTVYRGLCDLAGLPERPFKETYSARETEQTRLDLGGKERPAPKTRRIVPEEPECATEESIEAFRKLIEATARRCSKALKRSSIRMHGWNVIFGDGTDLEVDGDCFDAACMGRNGNKILRLMLLMIGPVTISGDILPGNVDEGTWLPQMIDRAKNPVKDITGSCSKLLALMDAAYFERKVIEAL